MESIMFNKIRFLSRYFLPINILIILILISTNIFADSLKKPKLPEDYLLSQPDKKQFFYGEFEVNMYAESFSQGNAVYLELLANKKVLSSLKNITAEFNNNTFALNKKPWGWRALLPISPEAEGNTIDLKISYSYKGKDITTYYKIPFVKTDFPVTEDYLAFGKLSDQSYLQSAEIVSFIAECSRKKSEIFKRKSSDMLGNQFSHPRDLHYITSPFWGKRKYIQYKTIKGKKILLKTTENIHKGIDLRGKEGTPVYAIADGEIVMSEMMFYEGNFTVIDHGNSIFSYYMHQSELLVKPGDKVKAGDLIGYVGSTGRSTASHLHISLIINGTQVNPLSILALPIRN